MVAESSMKMSKSNEVIQSCEKKSSQRVIDNVYDEENDDEFMM